MVGERKAKQDSAQLFAVFLCGQASWATSTILSSRGVVGRDVLMELAGVDTRLASPVWRTSLGQGSLLERDSYFANQEGVCLQE